MKTFHHVHKRVLPSAAALPSNDKKLVCSEVSNVFDSKLKMYARLFVINVTTRWNLCCRPRGLGLNIFWG